MNVFTTVALGFSMHVGVKTTVNVVTTVALYVLACETQDLSECVYYSCTMLSHVGVKTTVHEQLH